MDSYKKALRKIKEEQLKYPFRQFCFVSREIPGPEGKIGPTGPEGKMGPTGPQGLPGEIGPQGLPGERGPMGPTGMQGIQGIPGPTGAQGLPGINGKDGTSVTILGNYNTYQELLTNHPEGTAGSSYLVGSDLYVWSEEQKSWIDVGVIRGPQGEMGPAGPEGKQGIQGPVGPEGKMGPTGPTGIQGEQGIPGEPGPLNIPISFFTTTSENYPNGLEVEPDDNLPIKNQIINDNNIYFSPQNNTLTFINGGTYLISFIVIAHPKPNSMEENANVISIGLKKLTDSTTYAGCSLVGSPDTSSTLVGYSVINILPTDWFKLVNTGQTSFIVESPSSNVLGTTDSGVSPMVSIIVQKLK